MLINELVRKGYAKPNLVTLDHEVFAQFFRTFPLPGEGSRDYYAIWFTRSTTPFSAQACGICPNRPQGLLGLDGLHHLGEWGGSAISIARYTNDRAGALTGVAQIHWKILRDKIFAMVRHKVVNRFDLSRPDRGSNTANGVLFEHWQGVNPPVDRFYQEEDLTSPPTIDDETFFETIKQRQFQEELQKFQKRFEMIKTFYSLDLLIFLNNTQPQTQGGGQWLAETLGEVEGMHQGAYRQRIFEDFVIAGSI